MGNVIDFESHCRDRKIKTERPRKIKEECAADVLLFTGVRVAYDDAEAIDERDLKAPQRGG